MTPASADGAQVDEGAGNTAAPSPSRAPGRRDGRRPPGRATIALRATRDAARHRPGRRRGARRRRRAPAPARPSSRRPVGRTASGRTRAGHSATSAATSASTWTTMPLRVTTSARARPDGVGQAPGHGQRRVRARRRRAAGGGAKASRSKRVDAAVAPDLFGLGAATLEAANRSQASARRRASQAGPPRAEDASAVNVVRVLPLFEGSWAIPQPRRSYRCRPHLPDRSARSGSRPGARRRRRLAAMPDYDVLSHRTRRPRRHAVARPARGPQRHGARLLGRPARWPWASSSRRPRRSGPWSSRPGARTSASASTSRRWPGLLTGGADGAEPARATGAADGRRPRWRRGPSTARHGVLRMQRSVTAVADCPKPVIAAVHGYCIGGGVDLVSRLRHPGGERRRRVLGARDQGGHRGRPREPAAAAPHHRQGPRGRARPTPARTSRPSGPRRSGWSTTSSPTPRPRSGRRAPAGGGDRRQLAPGRPGDQGRAHGVRGPDRWPTASTTWRPGTPGSSSPTTWSRP